MNLRHLVFLILLTVVSGLTVATTVEGLRPVATFAQVSHTDGTDCPDGDDHGHPCGPTCPCSCCHGHAMNTVIPVQRVSIVVEELWSLRGADSNEFRRRPDDTLHPKDIRLLIFRPPCA